MCIAAAPLALIAGGISAAGTAYSALAANAQARGAAAQDRVNQQEANRSAADALARGNITQQQHYRQVSALEGQQRAAMAANGLDIGFGSAADVVSDTAQIGQEDANAIAQNTAREARGFEVTAANYGSQAKSEDNAATGALIGGAFNTASTIVGSAYQYAKLRQPNFGPNSYGVSSKTGNIY